MIDAHYDLLSICYVCYKKNDYSKIEKYAEEIKTSGVKCIFANLYFESIDEMNEEFGCEYYNPNVSILDMFKISKMVLENYLPDMQFIYSIEGCDYLEINDLEPLYNEGLRSILLVWNNKNKYGSGNRSENGLTDEGRAFLNKAIDLGMGIDVSHANINTFFGIIDVVKEAINNGKNVVCYASHSNSRTLHEKARNLNDEQLYALKEINGLVGVLSNSHFISSGVNSPYEVQSKDYLEHIKYISNIVGRENVMLSTDNMMFLADYDSEYGICGIYDYSNLKYQVERELLTYFNREDTDNILFNNAYNKIVKKLNIEKQNRIKL